MKQFLADEAPRFTLKYRLRAAARIVVLLGIVVPGVSAQEIDQVASAEQAFKFIANTLQVYGRTGSINEEIGIDVAALDRFVDFIDQQYAEFTQWFSPQSGFCNFYRNPQNAIMEIEERAGLAFQYLPGLRERQERYIALDRSFQNQMRTDFGAAVATNVERLKSQAVSFEYLPVREMYGEDIVNFADTACR